MKQRIGYARVATDGRNLDLQRDALIKASCKTIHEEPASGKSAGRPQLANCMKARRPGDTLVVRRLDRLGRSLSDPVKIIADIERQGVTFESFTGRIEAGNATSKLVFHVFAALAEFERCLIREIKSLLRHPDAQVGEVAKKYGISRATLYQHVGVVQPRAA